MSDLSSIERRLRALEDINAIKDLKASYLRACDLQQPDAVRDCLVPEGAVIAYEGFPPFFERDSFVEAFRTMGCVEGVYDIHHGANPVIQITGEDSATGSWSLFFQNINLPHRTVMKMGVEYTDTYVRQDGRWWIASTATKRTSCILEAIDESGRVKILSLGEPPAVFGAAPAETA